MKRLLLSAFLCVHFSCPFAALAEPSPAVLTSPALLIDYHGFARDSQRFNERGTSSRALRDLIEILYDFDNGRPWGAAYFPEVNERLKTFRATVCKNLPANTLPPIACIRPSIVWEGGEVKKLQAAMLEPASLAALGEVVGFDLRPWVMPFRENAFSLVIGAPGELSGVRGTFWNLPEAKIRWRSFRHTLVNDKDNYRAGFDQKDFPALMSYGRDSMVLNDWLLRQRAISFAGDFKHAVEASRRWKPTNPIVEAKERLFLELYSAHTAELTSISAALLPKVANAPEHLARWEKEAAEGNVAEEVYEHVSYRYLRELVQLQGSFLAVALQARKGISPRQQALESLLTVQRYHSAPRFFAMELLTIIEPLTSHAFVLDAAADAALAQAFTLEQLKAILGMDNFKGEALFPAVGKAFLEPELFRASYLDEYAPDIKEQLAGRDFASLDVKEQLRILSLYLSPTPGKFRPQALYRLSALWLGTATDAELRKLADVVHAKRFP